MEEFGINLEKWAYPCMSWVLVKNNTSLRYLGVGITEAPDKGH